MTTPIRGTVSKIQLHNFRGMLALSVSASDGGAPNPVETETLYLPPETVEELAAKIRAFQESPETFRTETVIAGEFKHEPIREQYQHGERYTKGERTAEAIECYRDEWSVFCFENGKPVRGEGPDSVSAKEAKAWAKAWVKGEN